MKKILYFIVIAILMTMVAPLMAFGTDTLSGAQKQTITSPDAGEDQENAYIKEAEDFIGWMTEYTELDGYDIVDSDIVLIDDDVYTISVNLEPGFYRFTGQADSRCSNFDIDMYSSASMWAEEFGFYGSAPRIHFHLTEDGGFNIDLETEFREEAESDETYFGYVIIRLAGIDSDSRENYIQQQLDWEEENADDDLQELVSGWLGNVSGSEDSETVEFTVDEGNYYISGECGLATSAIDVFVYNADGDLIERCDFGWKYPWIEFEVAESQTISIKVKPSDLYDGFHDVYYCLVLVHTEEGWSPYEGDYEGP